MKTWRLKLINQREELVYWREAFRGYDRAVATVMPYGIEIKGRQMSFDKEE